MFAVCGCFRHYRFVLFNRRHGVENVVPNGGRNAESFVVGQVVMAVMMLPKRFEEIRRFIAVNAVVNEGIKIISHQKTGGEKGAGMTENEVEKAEKWNGKQDFRHRRHQGALRIVGVFVVYAMQYVLQAFATGECVFSNMKEVAVQHIFKK